ncbi:proteasome maturation protein [Tetranychus urticae]|uniref:Proteasome maturation protein n=1 Tax=Tetranychus urticae TaxID=32264 RepID=T1K2S3_TETUR|nr:proteasome maturation protein [Tetranychus urticae]
MASSSKSGNSTRLINPERNLILDGFENDSQAKISKHPLMASEASYEKNREQLSYSILQSNQGVQAPLKLMMERKAASQVGHLPFLSSSNAMLETLKGQDMNFGPEDMYNEFLSDKELMGTPHLVMERHLNIL